jgi:hypothetical protein
MSKKQSNLIDIAKNAKQIWALHDSGVTLTAIAKQQGISYNTAWQRVQDRAILEPQIDIIEGLSDEQIAAALARYVGGEPKTNLLEGVQLTQLACQYFEARHVTAEMSRRRKINMHKSYHKKWLCKGDAPQKADYLGANQTSWGRFEDEPNVPKAVIATVWGNSKNTMGSAAGMCADIA